MRPKDGGRARAWRRGGQQGGGVPGEQEWAGQATGQRRQVLRQRQAGGFQLGYPQVGCGRQLLRTVGGCKCPGLCRGRDTGVEGLRYKPVGQQRWREREGS